MSEPHPLIFSLPSPLSSLTSLPSPLITPITLSALLLCAGCGGGRELTKAGAEGAEVSLPPESKEAQGRLGPMLGEVSREKILDRLKGYTLCGLTDPTQRASLRFKLFELKRGWKLAEVECFFFGFQGIYQYLAVKPSEGRVVPMRFEGAPPAPTTPNQGEQRSAVHEHQGRAEVCGTPEFNVEKATLSATCKGEASGRCGAHGRYVISWSEGDQKGATPYFSPQLTTAQSCSVPGGSDDPSAWPKI